jgi:hypothetical protein
MAISPTTLNICLELLSQVSVPVTLPDAEARMQRLVAAHQELLAALPNADSSPELTGNYAAVC